jgi:heme-degrading monooxygenase HmoA
MPYLLVRHRVSDFARWKAVFDDHGTTRRANGSRGGRIFHNTNDPSELVILLEWDDLERARLFLDSDDLRVAMNLAGVTDRPEVWFLADGDRFPV